MFVYSSVQTRPVWPCQPHHQRRWKETRRAWTTHRSRVELRWCQLILRHRMQSMSWWRTRTSTWSTLARPRNCNYCLFLAVFLSTSNDLYLSEIVKHLYKPWYNDCCQRVIYAFLLRKWKKMKWKLWNMAVDCCYLCPPQEMTSSVIGCSAYSSRTVKSA